MEQLLYSLALLACPVGMGAMMWMMMRKPSHQQGGPSQQGASGGSEELTRLRAEVDQLRAAQRDQAGRAAVPPHREQ